MFLGKVGQKSIAFINHKPFHPGNLKNLERVWKAEEEEAARLKAQKDAIEQRKHEAQIEELRIALRAKERAETGAYVFSAISTSAPGDATHQNRRKCRRRGRKRGAAPIATDQVAPKRPLLSALSTLTTPAVTSSHSSQAVSLESKANAESLGEKAATDYSLLSKEKGEVEVPPPSITPPLQATSPPREEVPEVPKIPEQHKSLTLIEEDILY